MRQNANISSLCRCFALIDSSTLEQTRVETETEKMTHLESLVELGLSSTFSTILTQCSLDIFKVRLHTLHSTVFNLSFCLHTLESRLSHCLSRLLWKRCLTLQPPTSLRQECRGEWWLTCAELLPR